MSATGFLSLLFVTGSAITQKLIVESLPREGLRQRNVGGFAFCDSGAEALEKYSFDFPDIVFIDEALPDMSGSELLQKLLAEDANAFLIPLTSTPTAEHIISLRQLGAKGVIAKPFNGSSFDRYVQFFFKEKYKKSWNEVDAFTDKGIVAKN